jgi:nitrilase
MPTKFMNTPSSQEDKMTKVAAIQMVSTPEPTQNMATAARLIAEAAAQGAMLAVLPEYWAIMGMSDEDKLAHAELASAGDEAEAGAAAGKLQQFMANMARQHQLWLIGGTLPLKAEPGKVFNTTLVYDPQGQCVARYDKIHLFGFNNGREAYDESRTIVPGQAVGTVALPFGQVGLSVCYDLRFPELYRAMGPSTLIVVPAAFTYTTGQAHWEILLRARAIENQCYVLAAAQGGTHQNGRRTFGHSMLINPWGEIIAVLPEGEGVVTGELDLSRMQQVRENLPALRHRTM